MKFGKSLIATAFIGCASSVQIGREFGESYYSDKFDEHDQAHYRPHIENHAPTFEQQVKLCWKEQTMTTWCWNNVINTDEYRELMGYTGATAYDFGVRRDSQPYDAGN